MALFPPPSVLEIFSYSVTVVDAKLSSSLPVLSEYSDLLESDDNEHACCTSPLSFPAASRLILLSFPGRVVGARKLLRPLSKFPCHLVLL